MHNIKDIRNNFEDFKKSIEHRNFDVNLDDIINLDKENRSYIQKNSASGQVIRLVLDMLGA